MAAMTLTIVAENNGDFHTTICELADTLRPNGAPVPTDHKLMHSSDIEKLAKDKMQAGYDAGVRDGRAEAQQERAMSRGNKLELMLAHDRVLVGIEPGRAPFAFQPQFMATFENVPRTLLSLGSDPHGANYQRELIGTPRDAVGIYGLNLVSQRPMFLTRVDNWTLCPVPALDKTAEAN